MLGCELVWDHASGVRAQEMIEAATGLPCPCKRDLTCPLMDWLEAAGVLGAERAAA